MGNEGGRTSKERRGWEKRGGEGREGERRGEALGQLTSLTAVYPHSWAVPSRS